MSDRNETTGEGRTGAIVLAAGQGTRMRASGPKVLQPLLGKPLIEHVLDAIAAAGVDGPAVVVVPADDDRVAHALQDRPGVRVAVQPQPDGTGGAALAGLRALEATGLPPRVLVACGDAPLIRPETFAALIERHEQAAAAATVLTAEVPDPSGYGRIVRSGDGERVARIVEDREARPGERGIHEINSGTFVFDTEGLADLLEQLPVQPYKGERYLTDVVQRLVAARKTVAAFRAEQWQEVLGVNTIEQLADAGAILRKRIVYGLMRSGVQIPAPELVWIEVDVEVAPGARIEPFSVLRRGARVGADAVVGPFAHLGPGAQLAARAEVGNFVEVKRSTIGEGAKAKHLAYIGDAQIGPRANVGAGTVFCNYDGKDKHRSVVGEGAFVGSGSLLVAPCELAPGARTGAGAVVTRGSRVESGETWVGVPARPLDPRR
ncbi:MAG: bifunctional N-acetylglucosamine-1-phosphate uridyltransferase/glucosamine-1-phosphate acetyltransferase [Planctomycetota bacterium]|nr:MAG: bifunctional N-acetylglucosamine-1-phosphate uridyltransferase/glucosamine-1-phosphate acetyltransferase [Planctomycetota bacterium]